MTADCLSAAIAVTSGTWSTRLGDGPGLSNLVFFDSDPISEEPESVPEPAAALGLLAVSAGLVVSRRQLATSA